MSYEEFEDDFTIENDDTDLREFFEDKTLTSLTGLEIMGLLI